MEYISEALQTPVVDSFDVIVAGGGVAGIGAAVAAARAGMRVLLLEKGILLGGLATSGLISWYEPLCDGVGEQMTYGIAEELLKLSIALGPDDLPEKWGGTLPTGKDRYATFFSPTIFALALDRLLAEAGVAIRLDITACLPVMEGGRCLGVITESKSGRTCFAAKAVIDATGDADLLAAAGVPTRTGVNYLSMVAHYLTTDEARRVASDENILHARRWLFLGADAEGNHRIEGTETYEGITNEEVTDFVLAGRRLLLARIEGEPRFSRDVTALPTMAQFRMTRRLDGAYTLAEADNHMPHDDSIGLIGDFLRRGAWYEIPFACLYHPAYENLLTAGRTISAEGHGWQVARVIPSAALTGQAAGTAAALAVEGACPLSEVSVRALQQRLEAVGVRLHHQL